jgi:succinyl-CoA synthetase beta subunit
MQGFDRVRRPRNAGASRGGASYLPGMDLLEYQGKQPFRKHGVPTPEGRHAASVAEAEVPFVVRLDGTNDKEGRALLAEANLPNVHTEATMLGAAEEVVELAG